MGQNVIIYKWLPYITVRE